MKTALAVVLIAYVGLMMGLGWVAQRRVTDVEDFVVAGRRLGLGLAVPTLLATWFGAGTLLAATDEVRAEGLKAAALDPLGAGVCLLLAGLWIARPLWRMKLITLSDFFARRYGPRAEVASALLMVPGYFGWIAAQFVALAAILELYFDVPSAIGLPAVAVFGVAYTLMGGMWAVTLTDAVQMALVALGIFVLLGAVGLELGDGSLIAGFQRLWAETPPDKRSFLPPAGEGLAWTGLFAAGALGNLPGQDLTQRIFAARSETVAMQACLLAGVLYLSLGMVPLAIGLGADLLLPDHVDEAILPALAGALLHPVLGIILVVTVVSAVLSTIDSAILAPAVVLAHNVLGRFAKVEGLGLHRWSVVLVTACSLGVALLGEDAWSLLETAYEVTMVSLLVPLLAGIWWARASERTALGSMIVGGALWAGHLVVGAEGLFGSALPVGLCSLAASALAYGLGAYRDPAGMG